MSLEVLYIPATAQVTLLPSSSSTDVSVCGCRNFEQHGPLTPPHLTVGHRAQRQDLARFCSHIQDSGRYSLGRPFMHSPSVVKANAHGHGAIPVSRHLKTIGVERLAVATVEEAKDLRRAGIPGPIHLLGSMPVEEAEDVVDFDIIPSISTFGAIERLSKVRDGGGGGGG
jgi:hypothetical protein